MQMILEGQFIWTVGFKCISTNLKFQQSIQIIYIARQVYKQSQNLSLAKSKESYVVYQNVDAWILIMNN